jgi:hypothetical protein
LNTNPVLIFIENIIMEGHAPEEEILSVLDVPPGKMGCVIGRKGATILSIKESCKYFSLSLSLFPFFFFLVLYIQCIFCSAEILIGGSKGPPDKVSLSFFVTSSWWCLEFVVYLILSLMVQKE